MESGKAGGNTDFFFEEGGMPDIFYSTIPINPDVVRTVVLYNVTRPDEATGAEDKKFGATYYVYKARFLQGFEDLDLNHQGIVKLHFPMPAFRFAWERTRIVEGVKCPDRQKGYDCIVTFVRKSVKKLVFLRRVVRPVGSYSLKNDEEEVKENGGQPEPIRHYGTVEQQED